MTQKWVIYYFILPKTDVHGNIIQTRIVILNTLAQFLGYWGTYDNTPFGGNATYYTNEVIVGPTTQEDIDYTFIDIPETGGELAYDFGEAVSIDISGSKNYDLWWLSIGEEGSDFNRYKSNGWSLGSVEGYDLTSFWSPFGWDFEPFHSYGVQFVVENRACRNGIEYPGTSWNNLKRSFFVCPEGTGCRLGDNTVEVKVAPNPASTFIRLKNLIPKFNGNYEIKITDLTGNVIKSIRLHGNEINIEGLPEGIFVLHIFAGRKYFGATKFVIVR